MYCGASRAARRNRAPSVPHCALPKPSPASASPCSSRRLCRLAADRATSDAMADRVLVVDDEQNLRKILAATLQREGYEVTVCADGEQALAALGRDGADVGVTDLVMPKMDGLSLLRRVVVSHPDVPVIVVTAHGRVDSAVEAMKAGAFDFVTKPFEHAELKTIIAKAARQSDLNARNVVPHAPGRRFPELT